MIEQLKEMLSQQVAGDGLPRNRGSYRIIEIDLNGKITLCRPRDWDYAFWGVWCFAAKLVKACDDKEDVLRFFEGYRITHIDDGMCRQEKPDLDFQSEGRPSHTLTDTITIETEEGDCFVIRDWDRTQRAYRLFVIHSHQSELESLGEGETSWRFKEYMLP